MSNFDRVKNVSREGFENRDAAHRDAEKFIAIGGKVSEGGERDGGLWGYTGAILVDDTHENVEGNFGCGRCALSGRFITYVENGKPKGPGGICYRCEGNGFHSRADRKRNLYHDMHAFCNIG